MFYFFQFGLMLPFTTLFRSQLPIAISTAMLSLVSILLNFNYINYKNILVIVFTSTLIFVNILFFQNELVRVQPTLIGFLSIGISGLVIGSMQFSIKHMYKYAVILSVINFSILVFNPFINFLSANYMRFGYAMVPSLLFFGYELFQNKKYKYLPLVVVAGFEITVYGSRGGLLVVIFFIIFNIFFLGIKKLYGISLILLSLVMYFFNESIMRYVINQLTRFNIKSYSFLKYSKILDEGLDDVFLSGREGIYGTSINAILKKPFFGWGIGYDIDLSFNYVHNFILQILIEFGVIGLFLAISIFIYFFIRIIYLQKNKHFLKLYIAILSVVFGRLLFSSDYWLRPEFWLFISLSFNYIWGKENYNVKLMENNIGK